MRWTTGLAVGFWGAVLILGWLPQAATASSLRETLARWNFSRADDANFDGFPDGWQREFAPGLPRYIPVEIVPHDPPLAQQAQQVDAELLPMWQGARGLLQRWPALELWGIEFPSLPPSFADQVVARYLRATLDGGAMRIVSPSRPVHPDCNYRLQLRIRTEQLKACGAWAELAFLDAGGEVLSRHRSPVVSGSSDWTTVAIGPLAPPREAVSTLVRLHLEPRAGLDQPSDLRGWAGFDDLWLERLPQVRLTTNESLGLYPPDARVEIRCAISGVRQTVSEVEFELRDVEGKIVAEGLQAVHDTTAAASRAARRSDEETVAAPSDAGFSGTTSWTPPPLGPGFYRVTARLGAGRRGDRHWETAFAILEPLPSSTGPFGWSLPRGDEEVPLRSLPAWLDQCRVQWIKYPCWVSTTSMRQADELAWLFERLQDRGISTVGVLDEPSAEVREHFGNDGPLAAATVLRDRDLWQPLLEPILSRLTIRVRWWQLGRDDDFGFLGRPQLTAQIDDIRRGMQGYGQPIGLVLPWPWLEAHPPAPLRTWQAAFRAQPQMPLSATELDAYLERAAEEETQAREEAESTQRQDRGRTPGSRTAVPSVSLWPTTPPWVQLEPLPSGEYGRDIRIRDLVERMIVVRRRDVPAAFVSDPFSPTKGLVAPDGTPGEMLLPWRTTAALLGSLPPQGSLELPGGSENMLFSDGTQAVLVLWSSRESEESVMLGEGIEQIDVWGRRTTPPQVSTPSGPRHRVATGPVPVFLVGIDPVTALWQMHAQLGSDRLDSLPGRSQTLEVKFHNSGHEPLTGTLRVRAPETWQIERHPIGFTINGHASESIALEVQLRSSATTGLKRVELDFQLDGERSRRIVVSREVQVGPQDVIIELTTRLLDDGRLMIRQETTNLSSEPLRLDCLLFAPGRQRQRGSVQVPPEERTERRYYWSDGQSLLGNTLLLRAEPSRGQRVLNYRIEAQP